ncbi:MAG: gerKC2, partial [Firmicutes bacterium]|nr:gerKC2 [Bacillota bacterium]
MLRRASLCILMLLMLTGCWSRVELNDIGVSLGMGVDQGESAPVRLTLYIARSMGGGTGASKAGGDPDWVVAREAQNIADAMREIALASPRRLTLHHLRVVVVGEDYARAGIGELMDFIGR